MANLFNAIQAYIAAAANSDAPPVVPSATEAQSHPADLRAFTTDCVLSGRTVPQSLRARLQAAGYADRDRGR